MKKFVLPILVLMPTILFSADGRFGAIPSNLTLSAGQTIRRDETNSSFEAVTLGTAATLNVGTSASNVVQLTATGKLPAVDGSNLLNLPIGGIGTSDVAALIHAGTSKGTPVDADETTLVDSEAANVLKKLTWANVKATLKTYFDSLYTLANLGGVPTTRQVAGHALSADITLNKTDVGLGNVDNTADANKSVAYASVAGTATSANVSTTSTSANSATTAGKWTTVRSLAGNSVDGSADVNFANKVILQGTSDSGFTNAQFLGSLGTGILKNTPGTGVLSIATASDIPAQVQYVSTSGNDANVGTLASPKATIQAAVNALGGAGDVIVRTGTFIMGNTSALDLSTVKNIRIKAAANEKPRFIFGLAVAGGSWTKTGGYTYVYQTTLPLAPNISDSPVFGVVYEDGTNYRSILAGDRHALQRGRTYALDTYPLSKQTSIANVDANAATFYYDSGTRALYIHAPANGNPITNGKTYYCPIYNVSFCAGATEGSAANIEIYGIESYYGYNGFDLTYASHYYLEDCRAVGSNKNGFHTWNTHGIDARCEAAACGWDGFNAHQESGEYDRDGFSISMDPYAHDNGDDGYGTHQYCQSTILGGLFEFNRDRGHDPAFGAHSSCFSSVAQKNGYNNSDVATSKGEGFVAIGSVADNGGTTDLQLYNCVSKDNNINVGTSDINSITTGYHLTIGAAQTAQILGNAGDTILYAPTFLYGATGAQQATYNGATITLYGTKREILTAARNYYVATTGSDSNDGLSASTPFATIQKAVDVVSGTLDLSIYDVTINIADGTYTAGVLTKSCVGRGAVILQGNNTTWSNVVISTTNAACISLANASTVYKAYGMRLQTASSGNCIGGSGWGTNNGSYSGACFRFSKIDFGACAGHHIALGANDSVTIDGNYSISGNTTYRHIAMYAGAQLVGDSIHVTITGTRTWGSHFIGCFYNSYAALTGFVFEGDKTSAACTNGIKYRIGANTGGADFTNAGAANNNVGTEFTGNGNTPTSYGTGNLMVLPTGTRYYAYANGVINTNGGGSSYFPAQTDGSSVGGGVLDGSSVATTAGQWTTARNLAGNSVNGSANVAFANKFITQGTSDSGLSGAQFLGSLGTGILKNTTGTGVLSIAAAGDFPTLNQNTTGSSASCTGNAASATVAASCTGNSATVTGFSPTAGKVLSIGNTITVNGTDGKTYTLPMISDTIPAGAGVFQVCNAGAVGDGTTDDTAAIQSCYTSANTVSGIVQFNAGKTYKITSPLIWDYAKVSLDGRGAILDFSSMPSAGVALNLISSVSIDGARHSIKNIQLYGTSGAGYVGIQFGDTSGTNYGSNCTLENFSIQRFEKGITWSDHSWNTTLKNGLIGYCTYGAYFPADLTNSGEKLSFDNVTFHDNTQCVYDLGSSDMFFNGCAFDYFTNYAIYGDGWFVNNCRVETNTDNDYVFKNDTWESLANSCYINNLYVYFAAARTKEVGFGNANTGGMQGQNVKVFLGDTYSPITAFSGVRNVRNVRLGAEINDMYHALGAPKYALIAASSTSQTSLFTVAAVALPGTSTFQYEVMMNGTSTSNNGVKFGINAPAGATIEGRWQGTKSTGNDESERINTLNSQSALAYLAGTGISGSVVGSGILTTSTAGNFVLQAAKVSNGTYAWYGNSYIKIIRISSP